MWAAQCTLCDSEKQEAADEGNESAGSMPGLQSNSSSSDAGSDTELDDVPEPEPEPAPAPAPAARRVPKGQRDKARKSRALEQMQAKSAAKATKEVAQRAAEPSTRARSG